MSLNDTDLIARVLAGDDRHAFGELVRRHQSAVRGFLRRLVRGQEALADDLAQETFIEAYRNLAKYRGGSAFSTWLIGIACNRWRNELRNRRATEQWTEEMVLADAAPGEEIVAFAASASVDLRHDLTSALVRLPIDEQTAINLCYQEGLTHEEAAEVLGCPLGTLKTNLLRAKDKLRRHLRAWAPS